MYGSPAEPQRGEASPSPCLLCPTKGARGVFILQGVLEGVLEERKDEEEALWTRTLLARDGLDGWPGPRPYVDRWQPPGTRG